MSATLVGTLRFQNPPKPPRLSSRGSTAVEANRKGTNGVSTNGVTANFMCLDRGTFWVLPLTYFYIPQSAFSPNLSILITFAAASLVSTPSVRN